VAVRWRRYRSGDWCNFWQLDVTHDYFENCDGIYIVWRTDRVYKRNMTIAVGQGAIRDAVVSLRGDPKLAPYKNKSVFITWTEIDKKYFDGVEQFLVDILRPEVDSPHPLTDPVKVDLPW